MSVDAIAAASPTPTLPELSLVERRVLGVLVEKAKTTPDAYPLSLNALVTGCNQKSSRDPVMNLSELDVEEALTSAQKKGLTTKITGGRVERWRHSLYEAWHVDKVELAVLAELLLRGPQTEGELRGRASRMEPVADLDALRIILRQLMERGLVVYLTPEGRRGTVLTHGFHDARELQQLRTRFEGVASEPTENDVAETPRSAAVAERHPPAALQHVESELAEVRATIATLQANVTELAKQVQAIQQALGL
jgi:uncharacterized protein